MRSVDKFPDMKLHYQSFTKVFLGEVISVLVTSQQMDRRFRKYRRK